MELPQPPLVTLECVHHIKLLIFASFTKTHDLVNTAPKSFLSPRKLLVRKMT